MYGRIHYENESGEFIVLHCQDRETYELELNRACRWIEAEPRRPLGMWGERLEIADEVQALYEQWRSEDAISKEATV
jgi:hypothetical protein